MRKISWDSKKHQSPRTPRPQTRRTGRQKNSLGSLKNRPSMAGVEELDAYPNSALALQTGLIFCILSTSLLFYFFPSFSPLTLLLGSLVFSSFPLILVGVLRKRVWKSVLALRPKSYLFPAFFSGLLAILHSSSLVLFSSHFNLAPFRELEQGRGFNEDSAFHVTLIHSIVANGVPSTLQHLDTPLVYHSLTHYVDALLITVLAVDPWEAYGLLFYLKGVTVMLLVMSYANRVSRFHIGRYFWGILLAIVPGIVGSWFLLGSHGQWVPVVILLSTAPWISRRLSEAKPKSADLVIFTVIVIVLSLGKVSLGFGLAIFLGLWTLFTQPAKPQTYILGTTWITFFLLWGSGYPRNPKTVELHQLFDNVAAEFFSILFIALFCLWLGKKSGSENLTFAGLSSLSGVLIISVVGIVFLPSGAELYHFAFGLFLPVVLVSAPMILREGRAPRPGVKELESLPMPMLSILIAIALALSPVVSKGPYSPYTSFQQMAETLVTTASVSPQRTATLPGSTSAIIPAGSSYFERFRDNARATLMTSKTLPNDALIFLSVEDFEFLESEFQLERPEYSGLLVTAVTGLSLVHGVPDDHSGFYGFAAYDVEAERRTLQSFVEVGACKWGKPVMVLSDRESPSFTVLCGPPSAGAPD